MELLDKQDINNILKPYGLSNPIAWSVENYSDELIGYLGDHLRLKVTVDSDEKTLNFFIKCMPRLDKRKADCLKKTGFFTKEFVMLTKVFKDFDESQDSLKWRPKLLLGKELLYVFEDVVEQGYKMPDCGNIMTYGQIEASVEALARFHAKSLIFEERKSSQLRRPYRLWEDYSDVLYEPDEGQKWRDAGMNAMIDFLKVFSKYRGEANFSKCLEVVIPMLFRGAQSLIEPSKQYRNVIIHRDLWSNNIFLKQQDNDGGYHVLFVDFQTVLYSSPMLDLSSFIFFNTNKDIRKAHIDHVLDVYHKILSHELNNSNLDIDTIFDKQMLLKAYDESVIFGITQAAIIVPIIAMSSDKRTHIFCNPDTSEVVNTVSRSKEFIQVASEDDRYKDRVIELFDDIVERYVYTNMHN